MAGELFRSEVIQAQRPQAFGSIRLATPISHQIWGLAAAIATIVIVLWLYVGHYTRREHVSGSLVPQAGLLTVAARDAGTVSQLNVKPGMHVRTGEALLRISSDRSSVTLGDAAAAVATALQQQQTQIHATLADLPIQTSNQAHDLRNRIAMLDRQMHQIDAQLALQREQASTAARFVSKIESVREKGIISIAQFNQYKAGALAAQADVKGLERQRLDTEQQRSQLDAQLRQLPLTTATTEHQLRVQLAQIATSMAQNELARDSVLHASTTGTVTSVLVKHGQAVEVGQPLLSVLPKDTRLEAQLLVPSSAIGFVHPGTSVILHYQAFPYQTFGVQRGIVSEISRSALTPAEITSLLGQQPPPTPLYRVEVELAAQDIEAYGNRQALLPGMTLDADLLLDRRRMIEWIFEPLYGMARRDGNGR